MNPRRLPVIAALIILITARGSRTAPPQPARVVEIVVPAGAEDANAQLPIPAGRFYNREVTPKGLLWTRTGEGLSALFASRELRRITVVRWVPGLNARTGTMVRATLFELARRRRPETLATAINWQEITIWTIEAKLEFSEGPSLRMFTDGPHVCIVDEAGEPWFFRMLGY